MHWEEQCSAGSLVYKYIYIYIFVYDIKQSVQ